MEFTINIDMDKKCKQCGKGGAADGGICLSCVSKNIKAGKYKHLVEKNRQQTSKKDK